MDLRSLKIAECFESPTNPRGTKFEGQEFAELVASIKEKGILVPVLARPHKNKFEVVAGNRRLRAAKQAGLEEIPAHVSEMTDIEAREAQIVENLQRADVHPLEEGAAYRNLIEQSGYDVEAVAAKVGKSESYVRNRLVLTNLIKPAQKAFRDDIITASHASMVARLDEKKQKDALQFLNVSHNDQWRNVPSANDLREWIQQETYRAAMDTPPWQNDEEMKATLGGCEECKGKGGDLFGKAAADACTNPKCFANRMAAYIEAKLQANPKLISISGDYSGADGLIGSGQYHEINGKKDGCDHSEKAIIVPGRGIGHTKTICRAPECDKHWAHRSPGGHYKPTPEERAARKKQREQDKKDAEKAAKDVTTALQGIKLPLPQKHMDVLYDLVFEKAGYSTYQPLCRLLGITVEKDKDGRRDYAAALRKFAETHGNLGKVRMIFALLLPLYWDDERKKLLKRLR